MQAIVQDRYSGLDVLQRFAVALRDIDQPVPKPESTDARILGGLERL
jgi:hypothetical protein